MRKYSGYGYVKPPRTAEISRFRQKDLDLRKQVLTRGNNYYNLDTSDGGSDKSSSEGGNSSENPVVSREVSEENKFENENNDNNNNSSMTLWKNSIMNAPNKNSNLFSSTGKVKTFSNHVLNWGNQRKTSTGGEEERSNVTTKDLASMVNNSLSLPNGNQSGAISPGMGRRQSMLDVVIPESYPVREKTPTEAFDSNHLSSEMSILMGNKTMLSMMSKKARPIDKWKGITKAFVINPNRVKYAMTHPQENAPPPPKTAAPSMRRASKAATGVNKSYVKTLHDLQTRRASNARAVHESQRKLSEFKRRESNVKGVGGVISVAGPAVLR